MTKKETPETLNEEDLDQAASGTWIIIESMSSYYGSTLPEGPKSDSAQPVDAANLPIDLATTPYR